MSSQKLPVSLRETGPHLQRGSLGPPEFTPQTSPILQVLTNIQAHADHDTTRYDTIRYDNDTKWYCNARSKADIRQLNLAHGTK